MTYQKSIFKHYHSNKHLSEFLPTRWRQFFFIYADTVNLLVFFAGLCRLFAISFLFEILLYLSAFSRTLKILYL